MMKRFVLMVIALFTATFVSAQQEETSAFSLQDDGSWVVIAVLAVVFVGLFVFLLATERKLNRIEKKLDKEL